MPEPISYGVRRLVEEREAARRARDFALADALRERIRELGFDVADTKAGSVAAPRRDTQDEAPVEPLDAPPAFEFSIQWVVEGWPEDAVRGIEAFRRHHDAGRMQVVVVDTSGTGPERWPDDADVVHVPQDAGWGAARNAGLRRSAGAIVLVVDGSVEPEGDVLGPVADALDEPEVGVAGPFGIVTEDLRHFHESEGVGASREVDAIEGYLMAFRRDLIARTGGFDEKFRFYRTADIDFSFRVKDRGLKAVVVPVPVRRHEHRMWAGTPEAERDRLSKRNFYRFLDCWRDRLDLCVGARGEDAERG